MAKKTKTKKQKTPRQQTEEEKILKFAETPEGWRVLHQLVEEEDARRHKAVLGTLTPEALAELQKIILQEKREEDLVVATTKGFDLNLRLNAVERLLNHGFGDGRTMEESLKRVRGEIRHVAVVCAQRLVKAMQDALKKADMPA